MSEQPTDRPAPPTPMFAHLAAAWAVLVIVEALIAVLVPTGVLRQTDLPFGARLALFGIDAIALGLAILLVGLPLIALARLERIPRIARHTLVLGLVFCLFAFYAVSWSVFSTTTYFIDSSAIAFISSSTFQQLQHITHMTPWTLLALPFVAFAGAMALTVLPSLWLRSRSNSTYRRFQMLARVCAIVFVVCALAAEVTVARSSTPVLNAATGVVSTTGELYAFTRDYRTGPAVRLLADLRDHLFGGDPELDEDPELVDERIVRPPDTEVLRSPIIPIEQWVAKTQDKPFHECNVLVLLVESLRADQLSAYGSERTVMPTLDALADESLVFRTCYTQASHSEYADPCPLSSHYPLRTRNTAVYPKDPPYPRVLIYDLLKAVGWRTAIISSQNENWKGMLNYLDTGTLDHILHSETFKGPTYVPRNDSGFANWLKGTKRAGKIDDRFTVNEGIEWIDKGGEKPWFVYMNLQNSHVPYETPADFPRPFGPDKVDFQISFGNWPRDQVQTVKDLYADSLAYVDAQIARLFTHLRKSGAWDRTLIVVTGDTGQAFYEHGFACHANQVYDEVMRVPLLIKAPLLNKAPSTPQSVSERVAEHIDVPPTVLDLLGLPPHPSFQGRSLIGRWKSPRSVHLLVQNPLAHQYAIVRGRWKLIRDARLRRYILYDLKEDPLEKVDLGLRRRDVVDELAPRLQFWRRLQIDYYESSERTSQEYPPRLLDRD